MPKYGPAKEQEQHQDKPRPRSTTQCGLLFNHPVAELLDIWFLDPNNTITIHDQGKDNIVVGF